MRRRYQLARDSRAPAAARLALSELDAELGWCGGDARLVASELVTNSFKHSDARPDLPIAFSIELADNFLRLEVCDEGSGHGRGTVKLPEEPGVSGGLGLFIVDLLADEWGLTGDGSTCAWALFDRSRLN
jgi:anti-sigma regulatory factor (Ser/Thr protein kinase)